MSDCANKKGTQKTQTYTVQEAYTETAEGYVPTLYQMVWVEEKPVWEQDIEMKKGQKLMVIYEPTEPKRKTIDLNQFGIWSERGQHVEEYMKEMRDNDRI